MTVAQLMQSLNNYPPNAIVVIEALDHHYRLAQDFPVVAVRSPARSLFEDDPSQSDGDLRSRGERRVAAVVIR